MRRRGGNSERGFISMLWCAAVTMLAVSGSASAAPVNLRPVATVALEGQTAPGTGGETFTKFDEPMVNNANQVTFLATYTGPGAGFFLWTGGVLSPVAVTGQVIPGLGTLMQTSFGASDLSADEDGPAFNNQGTVAFVIRLIGAIGGGNTIAVFQKPVGGPIVVIAKQGDSAPGTTGGKFVDFDDMSENNRNDLAFIATYTEDSGATTKRGVFLKPNGGAMVAIVLDGDALPGCGAFGAASADLPDGPWVNDLGDVAFQVEATCADEAVFIKRSGMSLKSFVIEGDAAPAAIGGTIGGIKTGRPALNNSDTLGFRAVEIAGGSVAEAVVTKTLGGPEVLCLAQGASAPGTSGTISGFADTPPTINQSGQLFITASVAGDVNVSRGIFSCLGGTLKAMVLQGDPIPGTNSQFSSAIGEASSSDDARAAFLHENTPFGVFVTVAPGRPTPALGPAALAGLATLLAGFGLRSVRRRRTRRS